MSAAVLVRGGPTLYRVSPTDGPVASLALGEDLAQVASGVAEGYAPPVADRVIRWARAAPVGAATPDPAIRRLLAASGTDLATTTSTDLRRTLARLPAPTLPEERAWFLALARARLATALASEEETLVALAREEERVERAVGRETGALEQLLAGPTGALAEYRDDLAAKAVRLEADLAALRGRLEVVARRAVPNLSAVVGPRIAGRLVAAAGGRAALARLSASRVQLLGARRRPRGGHGPRYGLLYRAARMPDVAPERQGRYARSLAALAVIAARADEFTRRDLAAELTARRDRRIAALAVRP